MFRIAIIMSSYLLGIFLIMSRSSFLKMTRTGMASCHLRSTRNLLLELLMVRIHKPDSHNNSGHNCFLFFLQILMMSMILIEVSLSKQQLRGMKDGLR